MRPLRVETFIAASPDRVWRHLQDVRSHVKWMADAESIAVTSDHDRGVGTTFDCVTRIGPIRTVDRMEVTEWSDNEAMGVRHRGVVSGRGRFSLQAEGDGTRLSWVEQLTFPRSLGGPVGAVLSRPVLRMVWRGNLRRFKRRVEASAAP